MTTDDETTFIPYKDWNGETVLLLQAFLPKIPAVLSIIGSYVILREVSSTRLGSAISTMLSSLSLADIIFSTAFGLSTWASPSHLEYIRGNIGTTLSCTMQGFAIELGGKASLLSNASLAILYLLRIRYHWNDEKLNALSIRLQILSWGLSLALAASLLPFRLYNNGYQICTIAPDPINCKDSYHFGDEANCEHGDYAWIVSPIIILLPTWICIIVSSVSMAGIYQIVRQTENRTYMRLSSSMRLNPEQTTADKDDEPTNQATTNHSSSALMYQEEGRSRRLFSLDVSRQKSSSVARQATWFIAAFLCTHFLLTVDCTIFFAVGPKHLSAVLDLVAFFLFPMQGLFNGIVFLRNQTALTVEGKLFRKVFMMCACCSDDYPTHQSVALLRGWSSFRRGSPSPATPTTTEPTNNGVLGENTVGMVEIPVL